MMIIRFGPGNKNEIRLLQLGCILLPVIGVYFILEELYSHAQAINQVQGGAFLILLAVAFLPLAYNQNMNIEIDSRFITIEKSFYFFKSLKKIDFKEIDRTETKGILKKLKIHLKDGQIISFSNSIRLLEGELEDISDPATSLVGRPREMSNLKNELDKRIKSFRV